MNLNRWIAFGMMAVTAGLFGCATPVEDTDASEAAVMDEDDGDTKDIVTCSGDYKGSVFMDRYTREQSFDVVVEPGAAAYFHLLSSGGELTMTATPKAGGKASKHSVGKGNRVEDSTKFVVIGNTKSSPQTYRISVDRPEAQRDAKFSSFCFPIIKTSAHASGLGDKALCLDGAACTAKTAEGTKDGTCKSDIHRNVSGAVGYCSPR